jgi:hypothetical protein
MPGARFFLPLSPKAAVIFPIARRPHARFHSSKFRPSIFEFRLSRPRQPHSSRNAVLEGIARIARAEARGLRAWSLPRRFWSGRPDALYREAPEATPWHRVGTFRRQVLVTHFS